MRIRTIHIYRHDLPVRGGEFRLASTSVSSLDTTIVEILTDRGIKGYGEVCPIGPVYQPQHALGARSALEEMAPHLIGLDPLRIDCVYSAMEGALNGHAYAKAAVETALWDIAGHAYGARVCDLLGGARRDRVPSYYSIGVIDPDAAAVQAREKQDEGYRRLQVKVGGRPLEADLAAIRKVHEVLKPGVGLAVDANRGWSVRDALCVSIECREIPFIMEQPCATLEEIASLRGRIHHPVFLDEGAEGLPVVLRAAGHGLCDGFGLKLTRMGGLGPMRTIRDVCAACRLPFTCDDSWGGDIIAAACVHIAATVPAPLLEGVWLAAPYIEGHYDAVNGIHIEGGTIQVPRGPGLGIAPDPGLWGDPVLSFG
jgi:L-alanine-DL-glutamate epimerase-like enolase superfamily enzyme